MHAELSSGKPSPPTFRPVGATATSLSPRASSGSTTIRGRSPRSPRASSSTVSAGDGRHRRGAARRPCGRARTAARGDPRDPPLRAWKPLRPGAGDRRNRLPAGPTLRAWGDARLSRGPCGASLREPGLDARDYEAALKLDRRYADLDVGLADLSIAVLARKLGTRRILTFDERHFRVVRPLQGGAFTLLPADS